MGGDSAPAVDHVVAPGSLHSLQGSPTTGTSEESSCSHDSDASVSAIVVEEDKEQDIGGEDEPLIQIVECRICQEEDSVKNLEIPCACSGSLKFAHRTCVQRWCNEKGDIKCEICHQPYQPNYTAPTHRPQDTVIDISDGWTIAGTPLDVHDPRLLALAAAERRLLESEYDEYADSSANGAAFCRSAALILMALLLLRHAITIGNGDGDDDDVAAFFSLYLLRAVGFLLPCYVMVWVVNLLARRRQRQEEAAAAAALAAAEVAYVLQTGQHRGIQVRIAQVPTPALVSTAAPVADAEDRV